MVKEKSPVIKVIGLGTAGSIIIENIMNSDIYDVDYIACNSGQQVLDISTAPTKILFTNEIRSFNIGSSQVAESFQESIARVTDAIEGSDAVIILAGFGGFTGTFGTYLVAKAAISLGIVTIAVVTTPFSQFEDSSRFQRAKAGIAQLMELEGLGNRLFVLPNDELCAGNYENDTFGLFKAGDVRITRFVRDVIDILTENSSADADLLAIDWESEFNSVASSYHPDI